MTTCPGAGDFLLAAVAVTEATLVVSEEVGTPMLTSDTALLDLFFIFFDMLIVLLVEMGAAVIEAVVEEEAEEEEEEEEEAEVDAEEDAEVGAEVGTDVVAAAVVFGSKGAT